MGVIGLFVGPFLMALLFAWLREDAAPAAIEVAPAAEKIERIR